MPNKRSLIPIAYEDLSNWPDVDVHNLPEAERSTYLNRVKAICLYSEGESYQKIKDETGKSRTEVSRLIKRCLKIANDGKIFGFRALRRNQRINPYVRAKTTSGDICDLKLKHAGALDNVFQRFPDVLDKVRDSYFGRSTQSRVGEKGMSIKAIHRIFLKELRACGLGDQDWPFNTRNVGYKSLCLFCKNLAITETDRAIRSRGGVDAQRRRRLGTGRSTLIVPRRPYSFAQLDFHKVDAASIITIQNENGTDLHVPVSRWHIGFLIEEEKSAILGAHIALEINPSGDSTLEVVESALRPLVLQEDDPRFKYISDGKALLFQMEPALSYQCFAALRVDNAWGNAAHEVVSNIMSTVGCAVNFGPIYSWVRRNLIEKINGELTRNGLQRLPSTHGKGPSDIRVNNPNGTAMKYRIHLSELIGILFAAVRSHNMSQTERLQWSSPLESLRVALTKPRSGLFPQPLPDPERVSYSLLSHMEIATIRGNVKKGIRPYITCGRWRYTNAKLAYADYLIGEQVMIYVNRKLCRKIEATVLDTGERLGQLNPIGAGKSSNLSWRDHCLINRAGMAASLQNTDGDLMELWNEKRINNIKKRPRKERNKSSKDALSLAKSEYEKKFNNREGATDSHSEVQGTDAAVTEEYPKLDDDILGLGEMPTFKTIYREG